MRFLLFISFLLLTVFMSAQEQRPLKIRVVDCSTHRVLTNIRKINLVRIITNDGSVYKGRVKVSSDSNLVIKGNVIQPEMIKSVYNFAPIIGAASTIVFYPFSFIFTPPLLIWAVCEIPDRTQSYYVIVSSKSKDEIENAGIEEHKKKDSLIQVSNPDTSFQSTLQVNPQRLKRKANLIGNPYDLMFIGTDLEKVVVPNFSINAEYFVRPRFGVFAQMGYKPLNPDGAVFYMTNQTQPYYFCEHYMFRFSPMVTFGNDPKRHSFFFIGPTLYYKTMNADNVNFCLYNNGDGDDRYVDYWYDETIKGIGLRTGVIPKNRLGVGLSLEVSYRFSKNHGYYRDYWYDPEYDSPPVINHHSYSAGWYPCLDASVTWRVKIPKRH